MKEISSVQDPFNPNGSNESENGLPVPELNEFAVLRKFSKNYLEVQKLLAGKAVLKKMEE